MKWSRSVVDTWSSGCLAARCPPVLQPVRQGRGQATVGGPTEPQVLHVHDLLSIGCQCVYVSVWLSLSMFISVGLSVSVFIPICVSRCTCVPVCASICICTVLYLEQGRYIRRLGPQFSPLGQSRRYRVRTLREGHTIENLNRFIWNINEYLVCRASSSGSIFSNGLQLHSHLKALFKPEPKV